MNGQELTIDEFDSGDPGDWSVAVYFQGEYLWGCEVFVFEVGQFLSIVRADPSYWNKTIVAEMLVKSLNSLDESYLDLITVEEAGWEDLINEKKCKIDEDTDTMTKVALIDGTVAILEDDEWEWKVKK